MCMPAVILILKSGLCLSHLGLSHHLAFISADSLACWLQKGCLLWLAVSVRIEVSSFVEQGQLSDKRMGRFRLSRYECAIYQSLQRR